MSKSDLYTESVHIVYEDGDESLERDPYLHVSSSNDVVHIVMDGDTLSGIAFTYYGDPSQWYKIADVNGYYNPLEELKPGQEILIPHGRK